MAEGRSGHARRKRRGITRPGDAADGPAAGMRAGYAKAEAKNQAAREALEPLGEGERPTVITVGAIVCAILAAALWALAVVELFSDQSISGRESNPLQPAAMAVIMTMMAVGLWRAKYWAALGFQFLLVLLILAAVLGMIMITTVLQLIGNLVILAGSGALFYFMVKAMARIQMPERAPRR